MKRFLWLGFVVALLLIWMGCGDTFRPVIIPNPPAFPDPRAAHTVISINNNNGTSNPGSIMVVDVSGDSDIADRNAGYVPVHAVQQSASQVLVVNQSNGLMPPLGGDSLTKFSFSGILVQSTSDISLPQGSAPNFVAAAPSDTLAYVTLPNYFDPIQNKFVPSVGVVDIQRNALETTIPVGNKPVAAAVTPDKSKLYVANQDSDSVSSFNTLDRSPRLIDTTLFPNPFSAPLWVVARSDSQRVYVLNGNGTLATLDPTFKAGTVDQVIDAGRNVGSAAYMLYDGHLNRLYLPGGSQLVVMDVSTSTPTPLGAPITIPTVPPSSRSAQDPCFSTVATNLGAVSVAALPDGSRAYVGAYYTDSAGNICPQVTVINASGNTIKTATPVPGFPAYDAVCSPGVFPPTRFRFTMAAAGDSSHVYLASCDGGNVNVIDTFNDTYLLNLPAPVSARPPIPPNTQPPPQNPVFLIAGP
jgi:DNA-binding beta-propeller fold protein YncE